MIAEYGQSFGIPRGKVREELAATIGILLTSLRWTKQAKNLVPRGEFRLLFKRDWYTDSETGKQTRGLTVAYRQYLGD